MLSKVAEQAESIHKDAGALTFERIDRRILLGVKQDGADSRDGYAGPSADLKLMSEEAAAAVRFEEYQPCSVWKITGLPTGKLALRIRLTMTEATAKKLTGGAQGAPPESFWIDGDAILLYEVESDLAAFEKRNIKAKSLLVPHYTEFLGQKRILPRIFEYVEVLLKADEKAKYTYQSFSANTFSQAASPAVISEREGLNWLVMTPDYTEFCPYHRFHVRFAGPRVLALV